MNEQNLISIGTRIPNVELAPLKAIDFQKTKISISDSNELLKNVFVEIKSQRTNKSTLEDSVQKLKNKTFPCKHCGSRNITFTTNRQTTNMYYTSLVGVGECQNCGSKEIWKAPKDNNSAAVMITNWNKVNNIPAIIEFHKRIVKENMEIVTKLEGWMNDEEK